MLQVLLHFLLHKQPNSFISELVGMAAASESVLWLKEAMKEAKAGLEEGGLPIGRRGLVSSIHFSPFSGSQYFITLQN